MEIRGIRSGINITGIDEVECGRIAGPQAANATVGQRPIAVDAGGRINAGRSDRGMVARRSLCGEVARRRSCDKRGGNRGVIGGVPHFEIAGGCPGRNRFLQIAVHPAAGARHAWRIASRGGNQGIGTGGDRPSG